ncbi:hypothetical protein C8Q74DRAFT_1221256 [Fomes fomentarius]|nr:hypothetical protein C8Q74DRAFT_1221256 [Fomes fomentarius]
MLAERHGNVLRRNGNARSASKQIGSKPGDGNKTRELRVLLETTTSNGVLKIAIQMGQTKEAPLSFPSSSLLCLFASSGNKVTAAKEGTAKVWKLVDLRGAGAKLVDVPDQVARVVHKVTVPERALNAAGDWLQSSVKSVGDSLAKLAPGPAESEEMVRNVVDGAQKLAGNAAGEAQQFAENAGVEVKKLAESAAQDVGRWLLSRFKE